MESVEYREKRNLNSIDLLIIPILNREKPEILNEIDSSLEGGASYMMKGSGFRGEIGEICKITTNGKYSVPMVLMAGIGGGSPSEIQKFGGEIASHIGDLANVAIDCSNSQAKYILLGCRLRSHVSANFKTENKLLGKKWILLSDQPIKTKEEFSEMERLFNSISIARSLTSMPSNLLTPEEFARSCKKLESSGLKVEVLHKDALEKEGFHALLSVGKGSVNPPCVAILRWEGSKSDPIAFVGKGVCFDSGGINIKTEHLLEMKWDKAGAGAVVGLMAMLAASKAPVHAIGVVGLVENMVDGGALKPGDVINTHAGITVEVVDTDNEGRLVLCDCLSYVQTIANPSVVVDLGTLTLETFGALAGEYAGLFCNDLAIAEELQNAGERSGEKLWSLPMGKAFAKQLETEVADIKNCGTLGFGECGAAAEFLRRFIKPGVKWAHLDISGVAWTQEDQPLNRKGVTGFGVYLLYEWLKRSYLS